jgi:hypothetical protein
MKESRIYNIFVNDLNYYYQVAWLFLDNRFKLCGNPDLADLIIILSSETNIHYTAIAQERCNYTVYPKGVDSATVDFHLGCYVVEYMEDYASLYNTPLLGIGKTARLLASGHGATIIQHTDRRKISKCKCNHTGKRIYVPTDNQHQLIYYNDLNPNSYNLILYSTDISPEYYVEGVTRFLPSDKYKEPEVIWFADAKEKVQSLCFQSYPHEAFNFPSKKTIEYYREIVADLIEGLLDYHNIFGPTKYENEIQMY